MPATESGFRPRGFGVFEADLRTAELRKYGVRIKLQEQPFQILSLLLEHPGEVVTREEIRERLWPAHTFVDFDRSLNKAMTKLRAALGDSADCPRFVETIPRHGYRFIAPVHDGFAHESGDASALRPIQSLEMLPAGRIQAKHTRFAFVPNYLGLNPRISYGFLALIGLGVLSFSFFGRTHRFLSLGGFSNPVSPRPSVAVLSLRDLSGDPRHAWLSTAFSDWLTTELTAGEQVRTIPAESIARMRVELALPEMDGLGPESLVRIRKNLGTDFVVTGSYATLNGKPDGQIRLDLSLQDARTGETVGAFSQTGTEAHLLDLVSGAGERLRSKLGIRSATREEAAEVAIALPSKSETARLYSEGLASLRNFDALKARELLAKASDSEPNYALSHAALATAWKQLGYDENAKKEAKKAFDLSGNLSRAERLLVEGRYYETSHNWDKAAGIYRALFEFFPDNLDYGLALAHAEYAANQWKDTLATVEALRKLPAPLSDDPRIDLAEQDAARSLGDTKRSEAALARAAEKARIAGASLLLARADLDRAWLYENLGRFSEAETLVREAKQLYTSANDRAGVAQATTIGAIVLKNQGDYLGAKKSYEEVLALYRQIGNRYGVASENDNLGDILVYLGDLEGARRGYETALSIYREVDDQNAEALAMNGLGDVYRLSGDNAKAQEMYEGAMEICQRTGNLGRRAGALAGVGMLHGRRGQIAEALKTETEARRLFEEIGDKSEVSRIDLYIAGLLLDNGQHAEAAETTRRALQVFEASKAAHDKAAADLLLARILLVEGRFDQAKAYADETVRTASQTHDRELKMYAQLTKAVLQATSGNPRDARESVTMLKAAISGDSSLTFADAVYETRLALASIEMKILDPEDGRAQLKRLQTEASAAGFGLVAHKAELALRHVSQASL